MGAGVLNSAIFNSFHNRVEFGTILEGLRNFGGVKPPTPQPPLGTPLPQAIYYGNEVEITLHAACKEGVRRCGSIAPLILKP